MDLSVNPLPDKQRKYLESSSGLLKKNFNKSQYRTMIIDHVDTSIRFLHHIIQKSHLLNKEKIYDKINALTIEDFLTNSLKNTENPVKPYVYDFRTVELARCLFEISTLYLEQNPYLKVLDEIPENVRTGIKIVSEFYEMLANDIMQREPIENQTNYFCPLKRLRSFGSSYNPHKPKNQQIIGASIR